MADMDLDDEASMQALNSELEEYRVSPAKLMTNITEDQLGAMLIDSTDLPKMAVLFVLDTNYLLSHLHLLSKLFTVLPHSNAFIIPWVVVQELDGLKKLNNRQVHGKSVGFLAREATRLLLDALQKRNVMIRGQKLNESIITCSGNDDRIMDCCLYFKQHYCPNVVLLTGDINLGLKSTIHDIVCFKDHCDTTDEFFQKIYDCLFDPVSAINFQPHTDEPFHQIYSDEEMVDAQHPDSEDTPQVQQTYVPTPALNVDTSLPLHDQIACSLINMISEYLPPFLHRKLSERLGHDRYVPTVHSDWTALTVIDCIRTQIVSDSKASKTWASVEKWVREWVRRGGRLRAGHPASLMIKPGHPKYVPWRVSDIEEALQVVEDAFALFCENETVEDRIQRQAQFKSWREKVRNKA